MEIQSVSLSSYIINQNFLSVKELSTLTTLQRSGLIMSGKMSMCPQTWLLRRNLVSLLAVPALSLPSVIKS
jgi:hypothetical protein